MKEKRLVLLLDKIETGSSKTTIDLELTEEFYEWFRKEQPSHRWSGKAFRTWLKARLLKAWLTLEQGEYKLIYDKSRKDGKNTPKRGDIVTFFKSGYRTRVVDSVSSGTIRLAPLFEGEAMTKINISEIQEILRPRKKVVLKED